MDMELLSVPIFTKNGSPDGIALVNPSGKIIQF
jgi:hypothetical protein